VGSLGLLLQRWKDPVCNTHNSKLNAARDDDDDDDDDDASVANVIPMEDIQDDLHIRVFRVCARNSSTPSGTCIYSVQ
jgi:hypothetical protein